MTRKNNTTFWKDLQQLKIPETLEYKLEIWKHKIPIDEDFNRLSDYILFKANSFAVVMDGLDLFNRDSIKREFYTNHDYLTMAAKEVVDHQKTYDSSLTTLSHKEFISMLRRL